MYHDVSITTLLAPFADSVRAPVDAVRGVLFWARCCVSWACWCVCQWRCSSGCFAGLLLLLFCSLGAVGDIIDGCWDSVNMLDAHGDGYLREGRDRLGPQRRFLVRRNKLVCSFGTLAVQS